MIETASTHPCTGIERLINFLHDKFDGLGLGLGTVVARFDGVFDSERLREALAKVQGRHSKLRSALVMDATGWPCFEAVDNPPPIPLEIRRESDPNAWTTVALDPPPQPFPPATVPLVRLLLLEESRGRHCDLIGVFHHVITDGPSAFSFLRDMVRFYGQPNTPLEPAPGGFGIVPEGPTKRLDQLSLGLQFAGRIFRRKFADVVARPPLPTDEVKSPGSVQRWVWSKEETDALVRRCHEKRTTLFGAMGAATLAGLTRQFGWEGRTLACQVPINVRPLIRPAVDSDVFGPFISAARLLMAPFQTGNFWEQARHCRPQLRDVFDRDNPLDPLRLASMIPVSPRRLPRHTATFALNVLGRMPSIDVEDSPRLTEYSWFGKQHISGVPLAVQVITVSDRLNLTLRAECLSLPTVQQTGEAIQAALRDAIQAT